MRTCEKPVVTGLRGNVTRISTRCVTPCGKRPARVRRDVEWSLGPAVLCDACYDNIMRGSAVLADIGSDMLLMAERELAAGRVDMIEQIGKYAK